MVLSGVYANQISRFDSNKQSWVGIGIGSDNNRA